MNSPVRGICLFTTCTVLALSQTVAVLIAPFRDPSKSTPGLDNEIGNRVGVILNLQIWQTLRIPPSGPGRNTRGLTYWDVSSRPPSSFAEASALASAISPDRPQLVLWGKALPYGKQYLVQAFLSIYSADHIWKLSVAGTKPFSVDVPERQIDFAPFVLRSDLLPELRDPSGLKLYANSTGSQIIDTAGNSLQALEQYSDSAKVELPNGEIGWVRLPTLSRDRSEVVLFTSALLRMYRQDWSGAKDLFRKVLEIHSVPESVRVDCLLYLAVIADQMGEDPFIWVEQAYDLNPYSKIVVEYLCMARLSQISKMRASGRGHESVDVTASLRNIVSHHKALFDINDAWYTRIKNFAENGQ